MTYISTHIHHTLQAIMINKPPHHNLYQSDSLQTNRSTDYGNPR
ncbi:hypothetical protein BUH_6746 [Burkholderia pseudomallei Pakistan 9]|nr:hypothetical protein BUH_6746 [Burkholderia pseudomallei Pakistan 9]